ncbi:MAG: ABC transporter ATP-binding protein [Pseudomonadaceae bacterium]|nr:ABC transporter ATP-binding protein [Pseudomonadaceae bacterium]
MTHLKLQDVSVAYPVFGSSRTTETEVTETAANKPIGGSIRARGGKNFVVALEKITLSLSAGSRLGIVGHNGAGKSTLLRTMAGIYSPTAGSVSVEGRVGTMFSTGLGMQANATGRENITLSGLLNGLTRKQAVEKYEGIAEFCELGSYLDFPVNTYSRGMAMRLSFAMATAFNPDVLLLDEWLGAGDQAFRKKAEARMQELVAAAGILVLASHRLPLIRNNCDDCLWLEHGTVKMFGPAHEVVAEFRDSTKSGDAS